MFPPLGLGLLAAVLPAVSRLLCALLSYVDGLDAFPFPFPRSREPGEHLSCRPPRVILSLPVCLCPLSCAPNRSSELPRRHPSSPAPAPRERATEGGRGTACVRACLWCASQNCTLPTSPASRLPRKQPQNTTPNGLISLDAGTTDHWPQHCAPRPPSSQHLGGIGQKAPPTPTVVRAPRRSPG